MKLNQGIAFDQLYTRQLTLIPRCGHITHDARGDVDQMNGSDQTVDDATVRNRAKWSLVGIIVALAIGFAGFHLLVRGRMYETAALFIGLPTLLAVALALTPRAKSATGMIMKGLTIALLLSGPLLGEGFICILFASPLFYAVGAIIGWSIDRDRREHPEGSQTVRSLVILPLILMSLEGVTPSLSFTTGLSAKAMKIVAATPAAVEQRLAGSPRFASTLPLFLSIGFPRPTGADGDGLRIGDQRTVYFSPAPLTVVPMLTLMIAGRSRFLASVALSSS